MIIDLLNTDFVFINLDHAVARREQLEQALHKIGITRVVRFPAISHDDGYLGLCKSQIAVLESNQAPFVLLEDDASLVHFQRFYSVPDDAEALYLGTSNWALEGERTTQNLKFSKTGFAGISRIKNMLSAHAILFIDDDYRIACIQALKQNLEGSTQISDVVLTRLQKQHKVYCTNEPLFVQKIFDQALSDAPLWTGLNLNQYPRKFQLGRLGFPLNFAAIKVRIRSWVEVLRG